jgi:hypothetical protein
VVAEDGRVYDSDRVIFLRACLGRLQRASAEGASVNGYFHTDRDGQAHHGDRTRGLHAPRTMTVAPATRLAGPRWWPGVAAWALWALTLLAIPVVAWLDHLSRRAGRPDLAQLTLNAFVGPVLACVSATTVGAVLASRRPRHLVGWLLLVLGCRCCAGWPRRPRWPC